MNSHQCERIRLNNEFREVIWKASRRIRNLAWILPWFGSNPERIRLTRGWTEGSQIPETQAECPRDEVDCITQEIHHSSCQRWEAFGNDCRISNWFSATDHKQRERKTMKSLPSCRTASFFRSARDCHHSGSKLFLRSHSHSSDLVLVSLKDKSCIEH